MLDSIEDEITRLMHAEDYPIAWRFIESAIFKLK